MRSVLLPPKNTAEYRIVTFTFEILAISLKISREIKEAKFDSLQFYFLGIHLKKLMPHKLNSF